MRSSGQNVHNGHVAAKCSNCRAWSSQVDAWWDFELTDPIGGWVCPGCGHDNDIRRRA